MTWVLASSSPRRKELLAQAGFTQAQFQFVQVSPDIDESQLALETPSDYVTRLALEKAQAGLALSRHLPNPKVIGSDTIVVLDGELLGKPTDPQDAERMLTSLSGRTHTVMTAVAITSGERALSRLCQTQVSFSSISQQDIAKYVATGEPMDKAGAYGIQGLGGCFVCEISGSYSSVVGLPLVETRALLAAMMEQDDTL